MEKNPGEKENVYYYIENGFIVFTEAYHLRRGYCCKSGCRHCPYGFRNAAATKVEGRQKPL